MIAAILLILIILWFLGYGPVQAFDITLFSLNGRAIDLWDILILAVILSLVGLLPSPFREIASVIVILWVLATLGILAFAGLSSMLVIAIIIGLVVFLLTGPSRIA